MPSRRATSTGTSAWPATLVAVRIMSRIGSIGQQQPDALQRQAQRAERQRQHDDRAGQTGGRRRADHGDERDQQVVLTPSGTPNTWATKIAASAG